MFTNKLNPNGGREENVHTNKRKKQTNYTLYNICLKKNKKTKQKKHLSP